MPVVSLFEGEDYAWGLWRIIEEEQALAKTSVDPVPITITNPQKRLEFLSARTLLKQLLLTWNEPFHGLIKDNAGKPFFIDHPYHLSLTHSYPFVAAIIHKTKNVGIDLEQPKEKLLRIAPRVLNPVELQNAGSDLMKHCVYWCAKETLIKIYGKRHLHLSNELAIQPFELKNEGSLIGNILAEDLNTSITLYYKVYDNFVIVLNT